MRRRCLTRCSATVVAISLVCRHVVGQAPSMTCRTFQTLADLLPDPKEREKAADPESFEKFKDFLERSKTPRVMQEAQASAAEAGRAPPVCAAGAFRSGYKPKAAAAAGRRLDELYAQVRTNYLEPYTSTPSADFVYRRGPVVQKFAGLGVAAGLEATVPTGPANLTFLNAPTGIAIDHDTGDIYVADSSAGQVMKMTKNVGYNVTVAFDGRWQNVTEADRIVEMSFLTPSAVAFDSGYLYIGDEDNSRIIRVSTTATDGSPLTADMQSPDTVAVVANFNGTRGMSGDCGPATLARMRKPRSFSILPPHHGVPYKTLAIADSGNNRIRTMEITTWPSCIDKTGYDCTGSNMVINTANGNLCASGSDCGFDVASPDECAFKCRHFGSDAYPMKLPHVDYDLNAADVQNLFLGCGFASAVDNAALLRCTTLTTMTAAQHLAVIREFQIPDHLNYFSLRTDLTLAAGTVIPAGYRVLGTVIGDRLKRLNLTEIDPTAWRNLGGIFRFAITGVQTCGLWAFRYTPPSGAKQYDGATGGVFTEYLSASEYPAARVGKCYLLATHTTEAKLQACATGGTADIVGDDSCRPGKISTILGGGPPGVSTTSQPSTANHQPILDMRLKRPSGMTLTNDGANLAPIQHVFPMLNLVVTDTANQRVVARPLISHDKYTTYFWLFIAGEDVENFVKATRTSVIQWSISGAFGWDSVYTIVKQQDVPDNRVTRRVEEHDSCDLGGQKNVDFWYQQMTNFDHLIHTYCEKSICPFWNEAGLTSFDCCMYFCVSTAQACDGHILAFRAAMRSLHRCQAFDAVKTCLNQRIAMDLPSSSTPYNCPSGVAKVSVDLYAILDDVLGISRTTNFTVFEEACDGITEETASGCNGNCDLKMADILGVDHEWVGSNDTKKKVVGLLYKVTTYDKREFIRMTQAVNDIKLQEDKVRQTQNNVYPDSWDQKDQWNRGTSLYMFKSFWYILCELRGYPQNKYRVTFSANTGYDDSGFNVFGLTTQVDATQGHQLTGSRLGNPGGIVFDRAGRAYVADSGNYRIVRLDKIFSSLPLLTQIAGNGYSSFNGNGLLASMTGLLLPTYLGMDSDGVLQISDSKQHEIRQVLGLTWNTPCGYSNQYWQMLSNASQSQLQGFKDLLVCRDAQVRINILRIIDECLNYYYWNRQLNFSSEFCIAKTYLPTGYTQVSSDLRNALFVVPPDCSACAEFLTNPRQGCELVQVVPAWNNTEDTDGVSGTINTNSTEAGDPIRGQYLTDKNGKYIGHAYQTESGQDMVWEMTWLLSDSAGEILLQGLRDIQERITAADTELMASYPTPGNAENGNQLKPYLDAITDAYQNFGANKVMEKINNLKTALCQTRNSNPRARLLLYHWYLQIAEECVHVPDSDFAFQASLIGGQYYDMMSVMVEKLFDSTTDFVNQTETASMCHPGCTMLHPRFYSTLSWLHPPNEPRDTHEVTLESMTRDYILPVGPRHGLCCGFGGYLCGRAEGPCEVSRDCQSHLTCIAKSCPWGGSESCCQLVDGSATSLTASQIANTVGYENLWAFRDAQVKYS